MSSADADAKTLTALIELLCDEAMQIPADELMQLEAERAGDVTARVRDIRLRIEERISVNRKQRLVRARNRLNEESSSRISVLLSRPLDELKPMVQHLIDQKSDLPERLTIAARKGGEFTDHDWETLIEDMWELGFLDEKKKES